MAWLDYTPYPNLTFSVNPSQAQLPQAPKIWQRTSSTIAVQTCRWRVPTVDHLDTPVNQVQGNLPPGLPLPVKEDGTSNDSSSQTACQGASMLRVQLLTVTSNCSLRSNLWMHWFYKTAESELHFSPGSWLRQRKAPGGTIVNHSVEKQLNSMLYRIFPL